MVGQEENMRNIFIKLFILTVLLSAFIFSCDVGLGTHLDLDGPVVEIISPVARKAVSNVFTLEGTVADRNPVRNIDITIDYQGTPYAKQYRYLRREGWHVSDDSGVTWNTLSGAVWDGEENNASWSIPVDLALPDEELINGEFLFTVQAWDTIGWSDDNSLRTRVLIYDTDPPLVEISAPFIHRGEDAITYVDPSNPDDLFSLKNLHEIPDDGNQRKDASFIGQFLTQGFRMQWQIEDNSDVWSIDIRFYKHDTYVDGYPYTEPPEDYIFRYWHNFPDPPPQVPNPAENARPNGSVNIPALDGVPSFGNEGQGEWHFQTPITEKTTVKVVTICYDAAGNANQEKILGYFIYWPKADEPWIEYSDGMDALIDYENRFNELNHPLLEFKEFLDQETFMIYPGRTIRATAFHAHGVKNVVYDLYGYDPISKEMTEEPYSSEFNSVEMPNTPRPNGGYSNIFQWEFRPPNRSGYYILKAVTKSVNDKVSEVYETLFRVQDISFPDFVQPVNPIASEPLYFEIARSENDDSITISGIVRDSTEVVSLDMVWINPQSVNYAAMSQLSYFREPEYGGWQMASALAPNGPPALESLYDAANQNKVFRLALEHIGQDADTQREQFRFSRKIPLSELNIGINNQPLISQMFLLRAENPDRRTSIITYAPQGDTSPPVINIVNIVINDDKFMPRTFEVIPQFSAGDRIQINGTWREDSAQVLDIDTFFTPNFKVEINGYVFPGSVVNVSKDTIETMNDVNINWRADITVGNGANQIPEAILRDTLVVNSSVRDIGGNRAESGVSWLIQSDHLRLMRISSEDQDGLYNVDPNRPIIIFMEFSKPVMLLHSGSNPTLRLNSRGTTPGTFATAVYAQDLNTTQSTRQYFRYTVAANDNTINLSPLPYLDVTGLETNIEWTAGNYPFTWHRGTGTSREEIRVTNIAAHNNNTPLDAPSVPSGQIYARRLPTTTINSNDQEGSDFMFTLIAGKRIQIDTQAPTVSSIVAKTPIGDYTTGAEISIEVNFNKDVRIGSVLPRLELQVTNGAATRVLTSDAAADVRVSGSTVSFVYRVKAGDTTNGNAIVVTGHTGIIEDLAGTPLAAAGISGFTATGRTLSGRYIDTITPGVPTVRIVSGAVGNDANVITNVVNGVTNTARSDAAARTLANVYRPDLRLAIQGDTAAGNHKLQRIEYSITNSQTNFVTFANTTNTPITLQPGPYNIIARQVDRAGNASGWTEPVSFTFMTSGDFVTRIDSITANGIYTNNGIPEASGGRQDFVNITVYFRENITTSGALPTLTLNVEPARIVTAAAHVTNENSISFTYSVNANENTPTVPTVVNLDVISMAITARDQSLVQVDSFLTVPGGTDITNANRLRNRKAILIQTGALRRANLTTGAADDSATYTETVTADSANDAWTGYFDLRFARPISKGSGNIVITQVINTIASEPLRKYRLPAVITEAQSSRYRSAANFDRFYSRGVNGLSGTMPDTSTKFILNYAQSTIVDPSNITNPATDAQRMQKLAYDFHQAEIVTIPLSSQDVEIVNGHTLRIRLTGSNTLAVLGAEYRIDIPANAVQDSISYSWPSSATSYTYVTSGINKPFVRIDKKVNADRIQREEGNANGTPQMSGIFTNVLQTTARLDCRTPGSVVRYNAGWYEHTVVTGDVNAHGHGDGTGNNWRNSGAADAMITFADTGTNSATLLVRPTVADNTDAAATTPNNGIGGTTGVITYSNFSGTGTATSGPNFTVGNTNESGYTLRIAARSRVTIGANTRNSAYSEEVAFRSVLTYELRDVRGFNSGTAGNIGWMPQIGTSLWIRGGDAPSTSSIAGFPLTWDDDYMALAASGARAGVRPMRRVQGNSPQGAANAANAQIWRWITWEVNVNTFNEVILGENYATTPVTITTGNAAATTFQYTGNVSPGPSNHVYEATVGSTPYYLRVISNTNNTFRLYANKGNTQVQNAGNGVNAGNNISVTISAPTTTPTVAQADEAWQFGPREWRYPRGGWVASKHLYTIQPGRHRWVRIDADQNYAPGGVVNWTTQTNVRPTPDAGGLIVTPPTNPANQ